MMGGTRRCVHFSIIDQEADMNGTVIPYAGPFSTITPH